MPTVRFLESKAIRIYGVYMLFIAIALVLGAQLSHASYPTIIGYFVIGFILWQFTEYRLHRTFLHPPTYIHGLYLRKFTSYVHMQHHANPKNTETLFVSLPESIIFSMISIPIFTLILAIPAFIFNEFSFPSGCIKSALGIYLHIICGIWIGYLLYEYIHFRAHHGQNPRWFIGRYLRAYHLFHHRKENEDKNFGVSSPFIDLLHGSFISLKNFRKSKAA